MTRVPLERDAQATILDVARTLGWREYHTFDSRKSQAGFPDLVLVRERVIFAEVKRQGQKPRADQFLWLDDLAHAGAEVYLWTLDDIQEIGQVLTEGFSPFRSRSLGIRSLWIPGHGRRDEIVG